jgi:HlyD family secretion protein
VSRTAAGMALALLLAGAAVVIAVQRMPAADGGVPTARVVRGPVDLAVHATGELRAGRSVTLLAPSAGGTLQLVRLAPAGSAVEAGDVVMEFNPAEQQHALEQSRSEVLEAEQEILKLRADAAVQQAQDEVALVTARFDVRRAELDALGNELIGAIDAQKNVLSLEEARRRLAQIEEDVQSRALTHRASLAVLEERRNKARLAVQRAEQVIESLVVRSPIDGLVSLKQNQDASGGFFFTGMVLPEYRVGDQVWPGRPVADVLDAAQMEIRARVSETDRANVAPGQAAEIHVDALPSERFRGEIRALSGMASRGGGFFGEAGATRQFDAVFGLASADARLRPGASVRVVVAGRQLESALHLPRQAVFERDGKPIVHVRDGDRFTPREVRIAARTESRVVVEGLDEGVEVALIDPDARQQPAAVPAGPMPGAGGGV